MASGLAMLDVYAVITEVDDAIVDQVARVL